MMSMLTAQVATQLQIGAGETTMFWILGPISVILALGLLFARKSVHAALCMVTVMLIAGVFLHRQRGSVRRHHPDRRLPGAVMMLFLFVVVMLSVDA